MRKELLKKLLFNALRCVRYEQGNAGCNDLFLGEQMLNNISEKELAEIKKQFIKNNPKEAAEYDNEMNFDSQVTVTVEQELEKLKL